jgi:hypothetical protein
MNEQQFAYWLQGFAELNGDAPPDEDQWRSIREHLALVFEKVTPAVRPGVIPKDDPNRPLPKIVPGLGWPPQTAAREVPWWERQTQCAGGAAGATDGFGTRTTC